MLYVCWQIGIPNSLTIEYRIDIACNVRKRKRTCWKNPQWLEPIQSNNFITEIIFLYAFHRGICRRMSFLWSFPVHSKIAIKCVYANEASNIVPVSMTMYTWAILYNANRQYTQFNFIYIVCIYTHTAKCILKYRKCKYGTQTNTHTISHPFAFCFRFATNTHRNTYVTFF